MEVALQVIMEQLKELSAGQSEINTTTAELKMDMSAIGTRQEALNSDLCRGKV